MEPFQCLWLVLEVVEHNEADVMDQTEWIVNIHVEAERLAQLNLKESEALESIRDRVFLLVRRLFIGQIATQFDVSRLVRRLLV